MSVRWLTPPPAPKVPTGKPSNEMRLTLNGIYLAHHLIVYLENDEGVLMIPIAADDDDTTAEPLFVKTHKRMTKKIIEFFIVRLGEPIELPNPTSQNSNEVLLKSPQVFQSKQIWVDGVNFVYGAAGRYEYGLRQPIEPGAEISIPDPVYMVNRATTLYKTENYDSAWQEEED